MKLEYIKLGHWSVNDFSINTDNSSDVSDDWEIAVEHPVWTLFFNTFRKYLTIQIFSFSLNFMKYFRMVWYTSHFSMKLKDFLIFSKHPIYFLLLYYIFLCVTLRKLILEYNKGSLQNDISSIYVEYWLLQQLWDKINIFMLKGLPMTWISFPVSLKILFELKLIKPLHPF